jgi:hypothetical protein
MCVCIEMYSFVSPCLLATSEALFLRNFVFFLQPCMLEYVLRWIFTTPLVISLFILDGFCMWSKFGPVLGAPFFEHGTYTERNYFADCKYTLGFGAGVDAPCIYQGSNVDGRHQ